MSKIVLFGKECQSKLISGVNKLSKVVSVTMGPRGKNVIIGKPVGAPVITKDGVSVARQVILDDPVEDLAAQLVKEVAGRTAIVAGDGTTTATVLTDEIMNLSVEVLQKTNPIDFRDGLNWAKDKMLEFLDENTLKDLTDQDIINIATVSTNSDKELGDAIGEAYIWAGEIGTVAAEAYPNAKTSVKKIDGITLKNGFCSPNFLTNGNTELIMEKVKILIVDRKITHLNDCLNLLNDVAKENNSLLVLSKGVEKNALDIFIENNKKGFLNVCCVNLPSDWQDGNALEDLSILTGATIISESLGSPISSATISDMGYAEKVIIDRLTTQIFNSKINENRRIQKMNLYKTDSLQPITDEARFEIKKRISYLSCKAAIITVGYNTELELREKGDRVEDAMHATYAAVSEGILPGGGTGLLRAAKYLSDLKIPEKYLPSANVLIRACVRPFKQIMFNADVSHEKYLAEIYKHENFNYGYNVIDGEVQDLVASGIVDPAKVTKTALKNAVSVSLLLINTETVLAESLENPSAWQPQPGWRPPDGTLNHKY